jgi:hypothetical protein
VTKVMSEMKSKMFNLKNFQQQGTKNVESHQQIYRKYMTMYYFRPSKNYSAHDSIPVIDHTQGITLVWFVFYTRVLLRDTS